MPSTSFPTVLQTFGPIGNSEGDSSAVEPIVRVEGNFSDLHGPGKAGKVHGLAGQRWFFA